MYIQVLNTYINFTSPILTLIYAYMLLYSYIYANIGVFWLVFKVFYHLTSLLPWQGALPTTPSELCKAAKCKCNIGQISQHLASALHFKA